MNFKTKLINVLLLNIFTTTTLCVTAQLLAITHGNVDSFVWSRFLLNFCVAYPVAGIVGMTVPAEKFGLWVCRKLNVKPGPLLGVAMALAVSLIYTAILSTVMTFLNVVVLGKLGFVPFFFSLVGDFIPMWLASSVVSCFITNPIMALAYRLTGEEMPQRQ